MELRKPDPRWPSAIALVVANLVPVYGLLAWDWSALSLLATYWAEMIVVAVLSLLRIVFAHPLNWGGWIAKIVALPFLPLFLVPLAMVVLFTAGIAIALLGSDKLKHATASILLAPSGDKNLMPLDQALQVFGLELGAETLIMIAALAASHLVSFLWNYLIRGECNRIGFIALFLMPVMRVWLVMTVVIFAVVGADRLNAPVSLLVALVGVKIALDLFAHLKEHKVAPQ